MTMKYVKVKRKINVGTNPGEKYLARLFRDADVNLDCIAQNISGATTVSYPDVLACLKALEMQIAKYVLSGKAVKLGYLGSFIPSISASAKATAEEVDANSIRKFKCRFRPSVEFKAALAQCKFSLADLEIKGLQ